MPRYLLNSYVPLVANVRGRAISSASGTPPFVDGSIRREPDLLHERPGISCLCRGSRFTPRLQAGDQVGYLTRKDRYGTSQAHRRLTAVLRVDEVLESHQAAADRYRTIGLPLPNNCMVRGNLPTDLELSHRIHVDAHELNDAQLVRRWDAQYRARSMEYPTYVITTVLYRRLGWDAPVVSDDLLVDCFGRVPGTQNPGVLDPTGFGRLMHQAGIELLSAD